MRPVRNVFQKLSRTEQRREEVVAYLCLQPSKENIIQHFKTTHFFTIIFFVACPHESGPCQPKSMRIQIHSTDKGLPERSKVFFIFFARICTAKLHPLTVYAIASVEQSITGA
jgi:hypothetical protein